MAKASSIAPKERINVTFKPATGGAVEEIELPLKVAVLGDFKHRQDEQQFSERKAVSINKNNFNDVMAKQGLGMEISVPNRLQDGAANDDIKVKLNIESLRDFEPGQIIDQVPELKTLNALRQALVSLKGPLGNLPTFRKTIEEVLKDPGQTQKILAEVQAAGVDIHALINDTAEKEKASADSSKNAGSKNAASTPKGKSPEEKE